MDKTYILIFGVGFLQRSLIEQCKELNLFTVGMDITPDAECRDLVDAFEVIAGDDYEGTLAVAEKYHVAGIITAATDKPLFMMARVAKMLSLPFYSVETAEWSTDKLQMKQRFRMFGIPCAKGMELTDAADLNLIDWNYPLIIKPRDNSGSRGVIYCENRETAEQAIQEAFGYTHKGSVLVEEFVEGQEFSIESLHCNGKTHVIQFTQKITTEFPYNVELGHIQPADLTDEIKEAIRKEIEKIAKALGFDKCASHTELKINGDRITIIETSPRLGGDFITSVLTPLSTGVNLEKLMIRMSIGEDIAESEFKPTREEGSGVVFFDLPEGKVVSIGNLKDMEVIHGCCSWSFDKKAGDVIGQIMNSIDRYGYAIFRGKNRDEVISSMNEVKEKIKQIVRVE